MASGSAFRNWQDGTAGTPGKLIQAFVEADSEAVWKAKHQRQLRREQKARRQARNRADVRALADDYIATGQATDDAEALHRALAAADAREKRKIAEQIRTLKPHLSDGAIDCGVDDRLEFRKRMKERHAATAEDVRRRLANGYVWEGGITPLSGQFRVAFREHGIRSTWHPHLRLFLSCLPKARPWSRAERETLHSGTKELRAPQVSKLLGCDEPYVEGSKTVRGFIRIDCDGVFTSWDALRLAFLHATEDIRLLPHIAVAETLSDGSVLRPHLLWLLPQNSRIRFDAKAFKAPQAIYHVISRALVSATAAIGSDRGGLCNPMCTKNPLCPLLDVAIMNERDPLTLSELLPLLEEWIESDEAMARRQAVERGAFVGLDPCESNALFSEVAKASYALMRYWGRSSDPRSLLEGEDLAKAFVEALGHDARRASRMHSWKAMAVLKASCRWASRNWDPGHGDPSVRRGILRAAIADLDRAGRMAAGGAFVAEERRQGTIEAMRAAIMALEAEGAPVTKAAVAARAGLAYRTVLRRWGDAVAADVTDGDKKNGQPTPACALQDPTDGMSLLADPYRS